MRAHALRSLALHGLDHLDAVVVAALASEEPLLLVGPHGSAKSALLNRIASALGLETSVQCFTPCATYGPRLCPRSRVANPRHAARHGCGSRLAPRANPLARKRRMA